MELREKIVSQIKEMVKKEELGARKPEEENEDEEKEQDPDSWMAELGLM